MKRSKFMRSAEWMGPPFLSTRLKLLLHKQQYMYTERILKFNIRSDVYKEQQPACAIW